MSEVVPFEFKFTPPVPFEGISEKAQAVIFLAHFADNLAHEDRTLVNHRGGRPENVAEHSNLLGIIAPNYAEMYHPDLDPNRIARYIPIHDAIEAYVGDTPTHKYTREIIEQKEALEKRGLEQLKVDFAWMPPFVRTVVEYEEQVIPETRFVRVFDKLAPLIMHFVEGGETYHNNFSKEFAQTNMSKREEALRAEYPEFSDLINVRHELSLLAAREFGNW